MKNLFVVVLRYLVPIESIDPHRAEHLEFLDKYYASGVFIASGRQEPKTGGIILARSDSRKDLVKILAEDPFAKLDLAKYQIFEFLPNKWSKEFQEVML